MFDKVTMSLNIDPLLISALKEDISPYDLSANAIIEENLMGKAELICKEDGILCGLEIFKRVFYLIDHEIKISSKLNDGMKIEKNQVIAEIEGDMKVILSGERTALNYLQRMSGIASYTKKMLDILEGSQSQLVDTRKTSPNNRTLEKYAVKTGGAKNHRYNLTNGVMLKDNHIEVAGSIKKAVDLARKNLSFVHKIEVETENLQMVQEALDAKADIIMLDNMTIDQMKKAIKIIDKKAEIEISGNINEDNLREIGKLGADYISMGALTHSSKILDFSLKNLHPLTKKR